MKINKSPARTREVRMNILTQALVIAEKNHDDKRASRFRQAYVDVMLDSVLDRAREAITDAETYLIDTQWAMES